MQKAGVKEKMKKLIINRPYWNLDSVMPNCSAICVFIINRPYWNLDAIEMS